MREKYWWKVWYTVWKFIILQNKLLAFICDPERLITFLDHQETKGDAIYFFTKTIQIGSSSETSSKL